MYILGISCWYHDSAATLIKNDDIIAAAQEERFTRIKHDSTFPKNAIFYCLKEAGINLKEIEKIVFYDSPTLKFKRILKTYIDFFPSSIPFIIKSLPIWLSKKLYWKNNLIFDFKKNFDVLLDKSKITNILHHKSHASSAYFPSKFDKAVIIVLDGVGEFDTTSIWKGEGNKITKIKSIEFPHSLGLLYSSITYYTGFKVNSGEYKVMGLAPYGEPKYVDTIKKHLINIKDDGTYNLNMKYFDYAKGSKMTNKNFNRLFGKDVRASETKITQFEMDMARSIQDVAEEVILKLAEWSKKKTGIKNLCLAGGVALNCVANGKIVKNNIFEKVWIQPASGDAGGSLGAALEYYYNIMKNNRIIRNDKLDSMKGSYLGPSFSDGEIKKYLDSVGAKYKNYTNFDELADFISTEIVNGKVIGWHQDRMEFGPRSLGNRSILGDPRSQKMQSIMNLKIKYRESFRPFAPSILANKVQDWFDINTTSPYMLLVAQIKKNKIFKMSDDEKKLFGIDKLNITRSKIPAVTHVDYSARIQTVHQETNPKYHKLISLFEEKTSCPIVVNTSFNVRGEPIVCTPEDSYRCFMRTEMDVLAIGNYVILKSEQVSLKDNKNWQENFQLD